MKEPDGIKLRTGMLVEVLDEENTLRFVGRVTEFQRGTATVEDSTGRDVPPAYYNSDVKLRTFQGAGVLVILGKICGSSSQFWKMDRLEQVVIEEKREYFRQSINSSATVKCVRCSPQAPEIIRGKKSVRCKVLDVSAGGVLISTQEPYQLGDHLMLEGVCVIEKAAPFNLTCYVQRVKSINDGVQQLGCKFEGLDRRTEDRLLEAIFAAQRQEIQKRRKG